MAEPKLDVFSARRLADIAERFVTGRERIEATARDARIGFLCAQFSQPELIALFRGGFLSTADARELVRLSYLPAEVTRVVRER